MNMQFNFTDCDFMRCLPTKSFSRLDLARISLVRCDDQMKCILRVCGSALIRLDDFSGLRVDVVMLVGEC
jgi:hypothetical protein